MVSIAVCRKVVHGVNHNSYYFSCLNLLVSPPAWERQSADPGESKMRRPARSASAPSSVSAQVQSVRSAAVVAVKYSWKRPRRARTR